jgi:sigma-B regulation protein RsbU (phosphoserine phosphatase)
MGDILIVDDTPANLRLLSNLLVERGYHARPVPDGELALEAVRAEPADLILLDIRMPGMNGFQVCEKLKADPRTRDIPVIFISALDATQDKVKAFDLGGVDYITKPFQVEEVMARIETHLTLQRLQRRLQEANEKMASELALAGEVQLSFLPGELPDIPGWQLSTRLMPARETSGDFYDVNLLPNGRVGLLVADVVDKGVGAALFMALSWILTRTYAREYPTQPELLLSAVNKRILENTSARQFVTMFYGILDPVEGSLVYCNAGHPPPYIIRQKSRGEVQTLTKTGVLLGVFGEEHWEKDVVQFEEGDMLVLYTDGITEAQNMHGEFYREAKLLESIHRNMGGSAQEVRDGVIEDLERFMGEASQMDDIALAVMVREAKDSG